MIRLPILCVLFLLVSCVNPNAVAERATYRAVAPEYVEYVKADQTITDDVRQTRLDTAESWRLRVGVPK